MTTVIIAGKEYALGELAFSDENVSLFETLLQMGSGSTDLPIRSFRRALEEAITSGSGEKKAKEAMSALKFSLKEDSDLLNAMKALGNSIGGA